MTLSIETHLSNATESIDAAELLLSKGFVGFAASCAYYAMFYVAEAFLLERGQEVRSSRSTQE